MAIIPDQSSGTIDWSVAGAWAAVVVAALVGAGSLAVYLYRERLAARTDAIRDVTSGDVASARDYVGLVAHSGEKADDSRIRHSTFLMLWAIHRMVGVAGWAVTRRGRAEQAMLREHLSVMVRAMGKAGALKDPRAYENASRVAWPVVKRLGAPETQTSFMQAFPYCTEAK